MDRTLFFSFLFKHCFIHAYHCHANGLGVFFLIHFLLEDRVVGLGITEFHSNRGGVSFLAETWLDRHVFLFDGLYFYY